MKPSCFLRLQCALVALALLFASGCRNKGRAPVASPNAPLSWQFEYDDSDRLRRSVDPAGRETIFKFEDRSDGTLQAMEKKRADGKVIRSEFDEFSRLHTLRDANGETRVEWAPDGRLAAVQRDQGPRLRYEWDVLDRLHALDLGEGRRVVRQYDFLGRPSVLETPAGKVTWDYNAAQRRVVRTLPCGVRTTWEFAEDGMLAALAHQSSDDRVILRCTYRYRADLRIEQIEEETAAGTRTLRYEYDQLGRLTVADDSKYGRASYRYDADGNRLEMSVAGSAPVAAEYDWAGRMTGTGGKPCRHDAAGNLVEFPRADGAVKCEFDAASQLVSATASGGSVQLKWMNAVGIFLKT